MMRVFEPLLRQNLSDDIAQRISQLIQKGSYESGARLPTISHMALQFGVGAPTLREALKKLETLGVVDIRHGSGVYVARTGESMLISNPVFEVMATKKLLVDLIEARIPVELETVRLASMNARDEHLDEMDRLLERASRSFDDSSSLNTVNLAFHRQIALASGNAVLHQILEVLSTLFQHEQRMIMSIHGRREDDHREHVEIAEALRGRDRALSVARMRSHLERVRDVLLRWEPAEAPR